MIGLTTFLLFGVLFLLVMFYGFGAHVGHGGYGSHASSRGGGPGARGGEPRRHTLGTGVDPVCGIKIQADLGYARMYHGRFYRFCSHECLDKFEADPDRYLRPAGPAPSRPP